MTEQFNAIIENGNEAQLIPFLQSIPEAERKKLSPAIKKLFKEYTKFGQLSDNTYGYINSTDTQRNMLQLASFVSMNKADYEKSPFSTWMLEKDRLNKVIDWCCPDWFNEFVNKQVNQDYIPYYLTYDWVMELTERGKLVPARELLAKIIPNMIFESQSDGTTICKPENLLKRKITLEEHIWYLFEVETILHFSDRFLYLGKEVSREKFGWKTAFIQFSNEGKIERQRLLRESLLASNRNFNKVLSGWFIQLFNDQGPSESEILFLQKELFGILSSPHSKVVNAGLQFIKKIIDQKEFEIRTILDFVPVLLSAETKATVIAAISILEKLAKKHSETREKIVCLLCQAFIHPDDDIQKRAAKIIANSAEKDDSLLKEEIAKYWQGIMQSSRMLLQDLAPAQGSDMSEPTGITGKVANEKQDAIPAPIPEIETIDDLAFLASQAFDNNESWYIDLLPASLIRFQHQITGSNLSILEPALQRALNMTGRGFRSVNGHFDHMLAIFFIDYCIHLVRKYPGESTGLELIFEKFNQKDGDIVRSWLGIGKTDTYISTWDNHYHDPFYLPYKQFFIDVIEKVRKSDDLPLLSTPTHEPAWILPEILIQRLGQYQKKKQEPMSTDLQLAVSRCFLRNCEKAIKIAEVELTGEFRELMLFLLGKNENPVEPFLHPEAWLIASLALTPKKMYAALENTGYYQKPFEHYTGQFPWRSVDEVYTWKRYDYNLREDVPVKDRRKILYIDFQGSSSRESGGIKKILSKLISKKVKPPATLYDQLSMKADFLTVEHNDVRRILLMIPNNPEPFLAQILKRCLQYPTFIGENDKKLVIAVLQVMHEIWDNYGDMAHLFLGTCMLSADKTVANIAAEIWLANIVRRKIDSSLLGKVIGLHENIEFAPLKRFTDLVTQTMFRVSDEHNKELQQLIENILIELPDTPIRNLKKLLEIYGELLASNNSTVNDPEITGKLGKWKENGTLQKIAASLIA